MDLAFFLADKSEGRYSLKEILGHMRRRPERLRCYTLTEERKGVDKIVAGCILMHFRANRDEENKKYCPPFLQVMAFSGEKKSLKTMFAQILESI